MIQRVHEASEKEHTPTVIYKDEVNGIEVECVYGVDVDEWDEDGGKRVLVSMSTVIGDLRMAMTPSECRAMIEMINYVCPLAMTKATQDE